MNRPFSFAIVAGVLLLLLSPPTALAVSSESLVIQVYSDGSAFITHRLAVDSSTTSVEVPLLSTVLSNVVATDQRGSPLSFKITGSNITVYTLGATGVTLRYDTLNLTSKKGAIWTLEFATSFNTTVVLPKLSTLTYISGTPYSLKVENDSPVATVPPGSWTVSYGVPIGTVTTTTSTGGPPVVPYVGFSLLQLAEIGVGAAVVVGGFLAVRWWRRRIDLGPQGASLRPDDVQVLGFIQEKGGKVLEPEIRTRFALPKTSAWRQIKRLERLGYLKVTKIGSQNQIELLKKREPGA